MKIKYLYQLSILYLFIPNIIFYLYWIRPVFSVVGIALMCYLILKISLQNNMGHDRAIDLRNLCIALIAGIGLTLASGIAGFTFQTMDHWCHNAKFEELMQNAWPLRFPAGRPVMAYYFGYYVVPAAISQLINHISPMAILVWTGMGVFLGLLWLYVAVCRKWWAALFVLCTGDFPRLFKGVSALCSIHLYRYETLGIEHWSNFENLFWAPNQFIPSVILGGMCFYWICHRLDYTFLCFPAALALWWAAFPALVMGLVTGLLLMEQWIRRGIPVRDFLERALLPFVIAIPVLLLFLSHPDAPENGLIWKFRADKVNLLREYLANTVSDTLLFVLAVIAYRRAGLTGVPAHFWLLVCITLLFPLVKVGKVNDMLLRGMMPVLILAGCCLLYPLASQPLRKVLTALRGHVFCAVMVVMLFSPAAIAFSRLWRAMRFNRITASWNLAGAKFMPIPYNAYPSLYEALRQRWSREEAEQYLGKPDSFYEKYIAPPPTNGP